MTTQKTLLTAEDLLKMPEDDYRAGERIPEGGLAEGFTEIVPDLIVEIISPSDRRREVEQKVREWIAAGARLVWAVRTDVHTVAIYEGQGPPRVLAETDTLTAEPVLPGFSVPVRELFA